jgi:hypothetical protein
MMSGGMKQLRSEQSRWCCILHSHLLRYSGRYACTSNEVYGFAALSSPTWLYRRVVFCVHKRTVPARVASKLQTL